MTNRHTHVISYAIAALIVILSFLFWTALLARSYEDVLAGREYVSLVASSQGQDLFRSAAPESSGDTDAWELERMYALSIPSIDVYAPILVPSMRFWNEQNWDIVEEQMQVGMQHGIVAYPHSVQPGNDGALILAGHSSPPNERAERSLYGEVFAALPSVSNGDDIIVRFEGADIEYKVLRTDIVAADDTSVLVQDMDDRVLRIITCFPIGTTKERLIVTAIQK